MGARQSTASPAELNVLLDFDTPEEATAFMTVGLPTLGSRLRVTDAKRDGDMARLRLRLDDVSPACLRAARRALVGRWRGRAFVEVNGKYTAWHSKRLSGILLRRPDEKSP